jgi:predicted phage terminase large subunit-like protein
MTDASPIRALNAALRDDLCAFVEKCFVHLNPGTSYHDNWHIHVICHNLIRSLKGETTRQVMLLPPRQLKSTIVSVAFPAFVLGHYPWMKFICVSYGQDLANKLSLDCRSVMTSDWYRELFPKTCISEKNSQEMFETTAHGGRMATSVGGTMTGFGGDFIIIDDPQKPIDMASESARNKTRDWFFNTAMSRFNDPKSGRLVVVMQRLHEDDLVGSVENDPGYSILKMPACAEETLLYDYDDDTEFCYKLGSFLQEERFGPAEFERNRREMGTREFSAQYQQNPLPSEGGILHWEWFKQIDEVPQITELIMSVDVALTDAGGNYTAITLWGHLDRQWYLIALHRFQYDFSKVRREICRLDQKYRPDLLVVESAGVGKGLISILTNEDGLKHVLGCGVKVSKEQRCLDVVGMIEDGQVSVLKSAPGLAHFQREVISFPNGKTDDLVDTMTQILRHKNEALCRARRFGRSGRQMNRAAQNNITAFSVHAGPRRLFQH